MKTEKEYLEDIREIRSIMERSSKFLSLSGWAGVMAGLYALSGTVCAYSMLHFNPQDLYGNSTGTTPPDVKNIVVLAAAVLFLSVVTALLLSTRQAAKRKESAWNATSRRLLANMALPLVTGGLLMLLFLKAGLIGLLAPLSLIFYGLSLFNAGNFTFREVKFLGIIQVILGLFSILFIPYSMLLWATGFGLMHIIYGITIYIRYQR